MEKKKYYKDGNPEIFREFNEWTWKNMTEREKSHWTPFTEADLAPIPKEVIEFKEKTQLDDSHLPDGPEENAGGDEEIAIVKEELRKLGIRYAHNAKLETLKKKLEDATN